VRLQKVGFTIVIEKSDKGSDRRKPFFVLGCERGDVYKEPKRKLRKKTQQQGNVSVCSGCEVTFLYLGIGS
jgi:hypothetical protein